MAGEPSPVSEEQYESDDKQYYRKNLGYCYLIGNCQLVGPQAFYKCSCKSIPAYIPEGSLTIVTLLMTEDHDQQEYHKAAYTFVKKCRMHLDILNSVYNHKIINYFICHHAVCLGILYLHGKQRICISAVGFFVEEVAPSSQRLGKSDTGYCRIQYPEK